MRELWGYVRPCRTALALALVLTLLASAAALAQPLAAKAVVDALGAGQQLATPLVLLSALVVVSAAAAGGARGCSIAPESGSAALVRTHTGTIHLDDRDIAELSRAELRSRLAWVDQDSSALSGTLAENLRFGAPEATDNDLRAALSEVRLEGLIERLPEGWHSEIGGRGTAISGGERQRLAIARALLRRPAVLLLDEASSQLDTVNELALRETIAQVARRATVVIIAHRMTTVTAADHIAVLEAGTLTASGTHDELAGTSALYRDLAATQLSGAH